MSQNMHISIFFFFNFTPDVPSGTPDVPNGTPDASIYPESRLREFLNADYGTPEEVLVHGVGDKQALGMSKKAAQVCIRHVKEQVQCNPVITWSFFHNF